MKLVMTILVKNELDIIEDNIRFHADQGVDAFLVMDNGSNDGTLEKLEHLSAEFDITIVINRGVYNQCPWMTALAKQARKELGADLVISNDADEFWSAKSGSLKHSLSTKDAVLSVRRVNMVQPLNDMASGVDYRLSCHQVSCPILYNKADQIAKQGLAIPLAKISPKVIVNPNGLIKIKGGNHRAKHIRFWACRDSDDIQVHHYPIRNYQQFENNIRNRKALLDSDPSTRMGVHYKRWVSILEQDGLHAEFNNMSLHESDMSTLIRIGVINKLDSTPLSNWFLNQ